MRTKLFALTIVLIALFASTVSAAPLNDSFAGATALPLRGSAKAKEAQLATTEVGENTEHCGTPVSNTVWFTLQVPYTTSLLLRTSSSKMPGLAGGASQVSMAIYTQAGAGVGGLALEACNYVVEPVANSGFMVFDADPGTTYYVQVGSLMSYAGGGNWKYVVNTRILYSQIEMPNSSFEQPLSSADWKVKKGTNDRVECSNPAYPAYQGNCAFVFEGGPGEKAALKQNFALPVGYAFTEGDQLYLVSSVRDAGASTENATTTVTVQYGDGTPTSISSFPLSAENSSAALYAVNVKLKSGNVSKVKVVVKNKSISGEMILDLFFLGVISAPTRDSSVLPLPAISQ